MPRRPEKLFFVFFGKMFFFFFSYYMKIKYAFTYDKRAIIPGLK
jgi:hypothetical protein